MCSAGPSCDRDRRRLISAPLTTPLTQDEIQRLNDAFNEVVARCNAELTAAEDERRGALMAVPAARAALEAFDEAVRRAEAAAATAQREADERRTQADEEAARTRADEENRAYATFLANDAETKRREARQRAEEECDRRLREVGLRVPGVSGSVLDAARRSAFETRDAACAAADAACEQELREGREALAFANDAALRKYADAAEAAALNHERQRAAAERAYQEAILAANQEFAHTVRSTPAAVAIEREYVETRMAIEQRADAEKQDIYRRLRGA